MTQHSRISFSPLYVILLIILMLPFVYAAFFTFPGGDDYARAVLAGHLFDVFGGIKEMLRAWMKWSGRYTHHFLVVFLGDMATTRAGYTIASLANMLLHYVALAGICREIAAPAPRRTASFLALFLLFSLASTHGSIRSSWYLLTDILCLGVGVGFTLMYIWSLCIVWNRPVLTRKHKVFCIAACIVTAGCYEYTTAMAAIISVTAYLLARAHEHRHLSFFKRMCVISFVCLLLSFFCRGNFRRRTKRDVDNAVMMAQLAGAWTEWCRHIAPKIITPLYLSLIAWAAWITPGNGKDATAKSPAPWIILYCLGAAAAFLAAMAVIHASSDVPLGEVEKIPAHMSIFCAMIFGFCLIACRNAFRLPLLRKIPVCLLFAACLAPLVSSYNVRAVAWNEATGALTQYAGEREGRKAYMREHAGRDVTVAPLEFLPFPIGTEPVKTSPRAWPTKYVSRLHGLKSIHAEPRSAAAAFAAFQPPAPLESLWAPSPLAGVQATLFARGLAQQPNETFTSDWLFLRFDREIVAANPALSVTVVSDKGLAASALVSGPLHSLLTERPAWLRLPGTERTFRPADPAHLVREEENAVIVGLPVNASRNPVRGVYLSLNGQTYAQVFATK